MVQDLNGSDKDASVYSGLLVSAFAIAETSTIMFWTVMSDRVGRKPIILIGLAGTAVSGLIFGFAKNFWVALLARLLGGALNGNVAVMQTMVSEMVKRPEHERELLSARRSHTFTNVLIQLAPIQFSLSCGLLALSLAQRWVAFWPNLSSIIRRSLLLMDCLDAFLTYSLTW